MKRLAWIVLWIGCTTAQKETNPAPPPTTDPAPDPGSEREVNSGLPEGFRVVGQVHVEEAFLDPMPAWRALRSRITMLQADAVAKGGEICVTFASDVVHATARNGSRRTWRLPEGLRLAGVPVHLVLAADSTLRLFGGDHSQIPLAGEVTIVTATVRSAAETVEKIRLVIKGGTTIRSISTAG